MKILEERICKAITEQKVLIIGDINARFGNVRWYDKQDTGTGYEEFVSPSSRAKLMTKIQRLSR